jgi:hypothetical protein
MVVAVVGLIPLLLKNISIAFAVVLVASIGLALREFASDFGSEPPNFS